MTCKDCKWWVQATHTFKASINNRYEEVFLNWGECKVDPLPDETEWLFNLRHLPINTGMDYGCVHFKSRIKPKKVKVVKAKTSIAKSKIKKAVKAVKKKR